MHARYDRNARRLHGNRGARGRADRAKVRGGRRGRQLRTKVELRPNEDDPEEQRQNADALSLGLHVLTKTELRPEWLRGQVNHLLPGALC